MHIDNCGKSINALLTSPIGRNRPSERWLMAKNKELIPEALFRLYSDACYFSFDQAPGYLNDAERILFTTFSNLVHGILESFIEVNEFQNEIIILDKVSYNPIKAAQGKKHDPEADEKIFKKYRYLVINLMTIFDLFSDIVALLLPKTIKDLSFGKGSFSKIYYFLENEYESTELIVSPKSHYSEELHKRLKPIINENGKDLDWYKLLLLHRNKLAHYGTSMMKRLHLHDDKGNFFSFMPKKWPLWLESRIQFGELKKTPSGTGIIDGFKEEYIHIDLLEFIEKIHKKVHEAINEGCGILADAYNALKDLPLNQDALDDINKNTKNCRFTEFK
jgi:hypothetical protein